MDVMRAILEYYRDARCIEYERDKALMNKSLTDDQNRFILNQLFEAPAGSELHDIDYWMSVISRHQDIFADASWNKAAEVRGQAGALVEKANWQYNFACLFGYDRSFLPVFNENKYHPQELILKDLHTSNLQKFKMMMDKLSSLPVDRTDYWTIFGGQYHELSSDDDMYEVDEANMSHNTWIIDYQQVTEPRLD